MELEDFIEMLVEERHITPRQIDRARKGLKVNFGGTNKSLSQIAEELGVELETSQSNGKIN